MTSLDELHPDFHDLLDALTREGAEFVIVGAHAMAAHDVPRATGDLDVLVRPTAANAARVHRALTSFGAPLREHGVNEEDLTTADTVYQMGMPPLRIDIMTTISGVSFDEAWATRITVRVGGLSVPLLGREALIRNKRATGRARDLEDLRRLEE